MMRVQQPTAGGKRLWHVSRPLALRLRDDCLSCAPRVPWRARSPLVPQVTTTVASNVSVTGKPTRESDRVLTTDALSFLARLHAEFDDRRRELLERRKERWNALQSGAATLDFPNTAPAGDWTVA